MKLSQFRYPLPQELIAANPPLHRDESKLMILHRDNQTIEHRTFKDIIEYFDDGDVFVINDTKVFPALLEGEKEKTGAKIKVFLLRELNRETRLWDVLVDPARKIRIGNKLYFGEDDALVAEVIDNTTSRGRTLRFLFDGPYDSFKETITQLGQTPIPEEIQLLRGITPEDNERYQTIYAKNEGAVAAPTAGLHFSRELMKRLEIKGIGFGEITLHAGLGNFREIDVEDLSKHKTDSEEMYVPDYTAEKVNRAKENKNKILAVGTTSMKAIESAVTISGKLKAYEGWTNKFIFPPYEFQVANAMITNFHLPMSSMLMMVSAFAGYDFTMKAYKEAIKEKYAFFTYGDAMLIL
ncbi:MAG: tRNA preQ1(34) S-adenosylmethionine ribosyltransferase-isomerase QueA [Bacteroidales bacterium]|nr:tRNA preQ1(34) S-adenosylmethionine ribosyltransferase-isomerase QueA [Bacteroidales bacterium]